MATATEFYHKHGRLRRCIADFDRNEVRDWFRKDRNMKFLSGTEGILHLTWTKKGSRFLIERVYRNGVLEEVREIELAPPVGFVCGQGFSYDGFSISEHPNEHLVNPENLKQTSRY